MVIYIKTIGGHMEELLSLDFINLKPQYIKIIVFLWNIFKCTFLFIISIKILRSVSDALFFKISKRLDSQERIQQCKTLKEILVHTLEAIIFAIYIINMLFLFGIDVRPLLATAGILGVAVGFGSKRLVEDVFSGIVILLEGQIRIGDYVDIEGMKGNVEKITLTLITVRSAESGAVYFIRCGYINSIKNYTMRYSYAFFNFDVGYEQNIDNVFRVINKSFELLKNDEKYKDLILDDIEIWGLDEFRESSLNVKCRIKTKPKGQWIIKRAFNKIIKEQFEIEKIEIPFNQLVISNK